MGPLNTLPSKSTNLYDPFSKTFFIMNDPNHMGFELSYPQGVFILIIDQDKITFGESPRGDRSIILRLDVIFMSLVGHGFIPSLFIELLEIEKMFFKFICVGK